MPDSSQFTYAAIGDLLDLLIQFQQLRWLQLICLFFIYFSITFPICLLTQADVLHFVFFEDLLELLDIGDPFLCLFLVHSSVNWLMLGLALTIMFGDFFVDFNQMF